MLLSLGHSGVLVAEVLLLALRLKAANNDNIVEPGGALAPPSYLDIF